MQIKIVLLRGLGGVNPALSEIGRSEGQIFLMKNLGLTYQLKEGRVLKI